MPDADGPRPQPERTWRAAHRRLLARVSVGLVLLASWELFVVFRGTFATPSTTEIVPALAELLTEERFWRAAQESTAALGLGYLFTVITAVPLGLLIGRSAVGGRVLNVYVTILLALPLAALVPVIIVLFGVGRSARVATIVVFAWPLAAATVSTGVATVDARLIEMARSYGCSRVRVSTRVVLPASLPTVLAGLRLSAGRAVVGMVVAELIVISAGFGSLIENAGLTFRYDRMYAVIGVMVAIGWTVTQGLSALERRLVRW